MHQGPCARPLNQKAPENGAFCCKNSQKTNPTMLSADRHLACLEARKNTDSNNRRSIEDTARSGQGLTKKKRPGFAKPSSSNMVPGAGLEPAQLSLPPPQDGVSTSFTTRATLFTRGQGDQTPRPRLRYLRLLQ